MLLTTVILNLGKVMWGNHASLIYKYLHQDIYSVLYTPRREIALNLKHWCLYKHWNAWGSTSANFKQVKKKIITGNWNPIFSSSGLAFFHKKNKKWQKKILTR